LQKDEDRDADADVNVVMTDAGELIEIQGTAEGAPFSKRDLGRLVEVAHAGIRSIVKAQKRALR
jgi:ribonuclease PH